MPNHLALPETPPADAAARREVIVVGAGVVGLSCALWLQRAGHRVTLVDREPPRPGADWRQAASYGNACTMAYGACLPVASPGVLRQVPRMLLDRRSPLSLFWGDLPRLLPWLLGFVRASTPAEVSRITAVLGTLLRLAEAGHAPLMAESGAQSLLRRSGCLYLYKSAAKFAAVQTEIALRQREGVAMRVLDADEIRGCEPGLAPLYHKAIRFDDTYFLDSPHRYALRLADAFVQRGGRFVRAQARAIESRPEQVGVRLGSELLAAQRVVVAAGAWSRALAATVGDRILLDTERGYHVRFPRDGTVLNAPCCYPEHGFYMTPLGEGLRAAGTVELGGLGKPMRRVRTEAIARRARELVTGLHETDEEWLGFRPSMPDSLPAIGASDHDPRVFYAFGHGHIGLTLAGITGRVIADLVSGRPAPLDLRPLRPTRFAAAWRDTEQGLNAGAQRPSFEHHRHLQHHE